MTPLSELHEPCHAWDDGYTALDAATAIQAVHDGDLTDPRAPGPRVIIMALERGLITCATTPCGSIEIRPTRLGVMRACN